MAGSIIKTARLSIAPRSSRKVAITRPWLLVGVSALWVAAVAITAGSIALLFGLSQTVAVAAAGVAGLVPLALLLTHRVPALATRVDRLIVLGVRWPGIAAAVAVTYVLIVVGLAGRPHGGERLFVLLSMIAAGAAALALGPLAARIDAFANQLAYGQRRAPRALLDDFARRLTRPLVAQEQLLQLAESLRDGLGLGRVDIWTTAEDDLLERAVSLPHRGAARLALDAAAAPVVARACASGGAWIRLWVPQLAGAADATTRLIPATTAGEMLGLLVVERPPAAPAFTATEDRMLTELGGQLGLALQTMKLDAALRQSLVDLQRHADQLEHSRARLVVAADTERRRIERDLHDGAQQRLSALVLRAGMAERVIATDPSRASTLIAAVKDELRAAAAEIRALAQGIYPPALEAGGLVAALTEVAERSPHAIGVRGAAARYPAPVEAAVYFCCLEAIHNAEKHGGEGMSIVVTVADEDGAVVFEVSDDGVGFSPLGTSQGSGITGMQDRIGALGGTVEIRSAPGSGTTVSGRVPTRGAP